MKRLFVAVSFAPGEKLKMVYERIKHPLRNERITWVDPANMHITLKFLGETEEEKVPLLIQRLEEVAAATTPFSFSVKGCGFFGSSYAPRVVWFGIEPNPAFVGLGNQVIDAAERAGFPRDRQNFVPHLTIGRVKSLSKASLFKQVVQGVGGETLLETEVRTFTLYESVLRREGPQYFVERQFRLGYKP